MTEVKPPTQHTPGAYQAVPDVAFDDVPRDGWALFPEDPNGKAIAVLLGPQAAENAVFLAAAPRRLAALTAIAETQLEVEDVGHHPLPWHDERRLRFDAYREERFTQIVLQARAAVLDLDLCLDCPACGGEETLGAQGGRPLNDGETAPARCAYCHFTDAHIQRSDGALIVEPGPSP